MINDLVIPLGRPLSSLTGLAYMYGQNKMGSILDGVKSLDDKELVDFWMCIYFTYLQMT